MLLLLACTASKTESLSESPLIADDSPSETDNTQESLPDSNGCENAASITLVSPTEGQVFRVGDMVTFSATVTGVNPILSFVLDETEVISPWLATEGAHTLVASVHDDCDTSADVSVSFTVEAPQLYVYDAAFGVPTATWNGLSAYGGVLWAASSVGLLSFDGLNLRMYTVADGLLSDVVSSVLAHSDGTIWAGHIATYEQQGERFSVDGDGNLGLIQVIDFTESTEIAALFRMREQVYGVGVGDVWMGTNEGACLFDYDLGVFQEHAHPVHPHGYSYGIAFSPDGQVWNGDQYQLSRWNYSNDGDLSPSADLAEYWVPWDVELEVPVNIHDLDMKDWDLWGVSLDYGVMLVKVGASVGTSQTFFGGTPFPATANAVRVDKSGFVWFGADAGLFVLDTVNNKLANVVLPTLSQGVSQITVDPVSGEVWVGVSGALVRIVGVPTGLVWEDVVLF